MSTNQHQRKIWQPYNRKSLIIATNFLPVPPLDGFSIASKFIPSLRVFEAPQYGLFVLMILFMVPGLGTGLYALSSLIINSIVGASFSIL